MDHTYLRYECADSFGLLVSGASSKAPPSNSNLVFLEDGSRNPLLLTTAGSFVQGVNLKTGLPTLKIGHREQLSGGVGSGKALNSDEVVCLDVSSTPHSDTIRVATGWVDGAVRVFDVYRKELTKGSIGMIQSLIDDDGVDEDFLRREPLLLNGHSQSPVRSVSFDRNNVSRLASGGSDGTVIIWDIIAETGLFRLLGHRGGITDIMFVHGVGFDGLATSSLDGLVKIWDLNGQCCTQTIANHHGEVWGSSCFDLATSEGEERRCRMIAGGSDGQARVWSVRQPKRLMEQNEMKIEGNVGEEKAENEDDVCFYMGKITPPPNVATSTEKILSIQNHPTGRYVAILHANSKNIDVYSVRSTKESQKKRQRRLRRRQEKLKRKGNTEKTEKKRGILDDDLEVSEDEEETSPEESLDPQILKASDEFEYLVTVRASHKLAGFAFLPSREKGDLVKIVCALTSNTLEIHSVNKKKSSSDEAPIVQAELATVIDMCGHPTGIRSVALSSDDRLACTVSKNSTKIWNVSTRSCILSLSPSIASGNKASSCYGLCTAFLPGNTHVAVGTREGHLLLIDIAAGDIVYCEQGAHDGAVWSIDLRHVGSDSNLTIVTGSADKSVKFWAIEAEDEESESSSPVLVHTRTLQMTDDVIAVRYSHSADRSKLLVFVATLDCTIKVFFDDSLKLFLSLYGHKLPVLALDSSDDDMILASSGADKTVKIFGLDFGDTHRTLHGHEDSITDLKFVKRTHNFFTASKDGTLRYWDGDRFQQILVLNGHFGEINALAVSRTGAFVLSGGMDRQIRVWERTKDIVFVEEEREREIEQMFDRVHDRDEGGTAAILSRKRGNDDDEDSDSDIKDDEPQSEAAVRKSVLSVSSGDRIMEALELADQETKNVALFRQTHGPDVTRQPNPRMLNMEPANYVLWVLKTVRSAELEQSLLVLPASHLERLLYYMIVLLRNGRGVELCCKVAVFMVKTHQNQIIANKSFAIPLRELKRLIRKRLGETRDMIGYDIAALKVIARVAHERKLAMAPIQENPVDIWAGLGLGSDVAAALQSKSRKR